MAHLTERENFFRMVERKKPDFVPHQPSLIQLVSSSAILDRPEGHGTGQDWFGVWWEEDPDAPGLLAPDISKPRVLQDISEWREVIKWPDLDSIDWKAAVKKDLPNGKDPSKILKAFSVSGPFERLHDLLGFEDALIATIVDPEECEAFFSRHCDYKIECIRKLKQYYDIDAVHFQDDWGTQKDLFFRPEFWREHIKPNIKRVIDATHDMGVLFEMHSCGKIDLIVDEIIDLGVDLINPVQPVNDLAGWKQRFGDRVIFAGGLNAQDIIDNPDKTPDDIKREVREKIDLLATNGYYIPGAVALSPRINLAFDEAFIYGRSFYGNDYSEDIEAFKEKHESSKNAVLFLKDTE